MIQETSCNSTSCISLSIILNRRTERPLCQVKNILSVTQSEFIVQQMKFECSLPSHCKHRNPSQRHQVFQNKKIKNNEEFSWEDYIAGSEMCRAYLTFQVLFGFACNHKNYNSNFPCIKLQKELEGIYKLQTNTVVKKSLFTYVLMQRVTNFLLLFTFLALADER